ncbi:hypothetical protein SUGI_0685980 [Cryptomeria japonica]|nr:hypothetical protein SUGI_0685980 [Cryptomeria japonica]
MGAPWARTQEDAVGEGVAGVLDEVKGCGGCAEDFPFPFLCSIFSILGGGFLACLPSVFRAPILSSTEPAFGGSLFAETHLIRPDFLPYGWFGSWVEQGVYFFKILGLICFAADGNLFFNVGYPPYLSILEPFVVVPWVLKVITSRVDGN